jgi:hypothetical protein
MKFRATYWRRKDGDTYYYTVTADSLSEAASKAEKLTKKGYIMRQLEQLLGYL